MKDKKIAVIRGGRSAEREISLKTGKAILDALNRQGYHTIDIDPAKDLHKRLYQEEIDIAFIALHGRFGEDGTIQGLLELEGIPYTGSGVLASALAMDKIMSKRIFNNLDIDTPKFAVLKANEIEDKLEEIEQDLIDDLGLPIVVKPALEGSSLGLSIVKSQDGLIEAIKEALKYDRELLVEEFIPGKEITIGLLGNESPQVLPIIEIRPKEGVYDFKSKYTKGMTDFIIPAELEDKVYRNAESLALKAYQALKCRGMGRVDLRVNSAGEAYVLEVNTIPGMTETSLLPQAAEVVGIDFDQLVVKILENALED
ncbi:D-alanine-D-alanine ligase [Orenia metallireducens]|uniref:D-alanine--D-alanine ligase n=1 Tax=Orenia metallireducens TaxID=1413210 RepID=A0A285GYC0_9FIRM|nr:D-alanine--D-alanine ligase [Orenia metallireducens]PRX31112.1 D-alanine-D-alanine ligase [Orenia metallireducens]SNY27526.1 D-alanine-D-alanine ligase [Orenia metallireducens]